MCEWGGQLRPPQIQREEYGRNAVVAGENEGVMQSGKLKIESGQEKSSRLIGTISPLHQLRHEFEILLAISDLMNGLSRCL
jgi:hypothetical protein